MSFVISFLFLDLEHEGMNSLCEMQNSVIAINKVAVIYNKIAVQAFWILKKAGSPIADSIAVNRFFPNQDLLDRCFRRRSRM